MGRKRKSGFKKAALLVFGLVILGTALYSILRHTPPGRGESAADVSPPTASPIRAEARPSAQNTIAPPAERSKSEGSSGAKSGDFAEVFPDRDTGVGALHSYQSDTVRIAVAQVSQDNVTYYIADIWILNLRSLATAFANDRFAHGAQNVRSMSKHNNAILAISGDYCSAREKGIVIRNGVLYRDSMEGDVCVLYQDGVMETYAQGAFDKDEAIGRGAYQAWCFGPRLLDDDAQTMTKFNSTVLRENPRSAIGYYEPGHYCFITVDGRQEDYSRGMTMKELSNLFFMLGCKSAYNLDGGQTAIMVFQDELVNQPYQGGRSSGDIIYIREE